MFCRTLQSNGVGANLSSDGVGKRKRDTGKNREMAKRTLEMMEILGQVFNFLKLI